MPDLVVETPVIRRFIRFVVAGAIGFLIEAVIITWLAVGMGLNVFIARAVSFSIAVTATWGINRNFAFAGLGRRHKGREYFAYLLVQITGAAINLGVFAAVIAGWPEQAATPVLPLAIGAIIAMIFNFLASRLWVFNDRVG